MKEQFVSYEIALKLKELGFDEPCFGFWNVSQINNSLQELKYGMCVFKNTSTELSKYPKNVLAPLYQQVIDFFREKYNIQIEILWRGDMNTFNYKIGTFQYGTYFFSDKDWKFEEYYEAREQAILKVIELIKE